MALYIANMVHIPTRQDQPRHPPSKPKIQKNTKNQDAGVPGRAESKRCAEVGTGGKQKTCRHDDKKASLHRGLRTLPFSPSCLPDSLQGGSETDVEDDPFLESDDEPEEAKHYYEDIIGHEEIAKNRFEFRIRWNTGEVTMEPDECL